MNGSLKTCAVCGKPLPPRRFQFCSDECQRAAANQRRNALTPGRHGPKPKTIICPDCGREVQVYSKSYRCPDCQREADARALAEFRKRKAAGKTRPIGSMDLCQRCGQPYAVESGMQKYCKACAGEALLEYNRVKGIANYHEKYDGDSDAKAERNRKRRLPRYSPINCQVCGREFIPETRHSLFCSPKCASIGHKDQVRAYSKALRVKKREENAERKRTDGMISVSEYAKKNGLTEVVVRNRCKAGRLPGAEKRGGEWRIPPDAQCVDKRRRDI